MPADEKQEQHSEQLLMAEEVAPVLGREQRADQVLARVGPALGDQLVEVLEQLRAALEGAHRDGRVRDRPERDGDLLRRLPEEVLPFGLDADQFSDDRDGQRVSEVGDHFHLASPDDGVEQLVDNLLDAAA